MEVFMIEYHFFEEKAVNLMESYLVYSTRAMSTLIDISTCSPLVLKPVSTDTLSTNRILDERVQTVANIAS